MQCAYNRFHSPPHLASCLAAILRVRVISSPAVVSSTQYPGPSHHHADERGDCLTSALLHWCLCFRYISVLVSFIYLSEIIQIIFVKLREREGWAQGQLRKSLKGHLSIIDCRLLISISRCFTLNFVATTHPNTHPPTCTSLNLQD